MKNPVVDIKLKNFEVTRRSHIFVIADLWILVIIDSQLLASESDGQVYTRDWPLSFVHAQSQLFAQPVRTP
jgi:hypothetical protein